MDSLVVRTLSEVSCISILGNEHWQYDIVEATAMATANDTVVGNTERVIVLDAFTGEVSYKVKHNRGAITSMHISLERDQRVRIMATTQHGELLEFKDPSLLAHNNNNGTTARTDKQANAIKTAPTLPAFQASSKKRLCMEISDLDDWCPSKMTPIEQLADDELPLLRGEFVMAFLCRNLRRKPQEA